MGKNNLIRSGIISTIIGFVLLMLTIFQVWFDVKSVYQECMDNKYKPTSSECHNMQKDAYLLNNLMYSHYALYMIGGIVLLIISLKTKTNNKFIPTIIYIAVIGTTIASIVVMNWMHQIKLEWWVIIINVIVILLCMRTIYNISI